MRLFQIGELYLLDRIRKNFEKKSSKVIVGIGDDAAVISPIKKNTLLTTDMIVEGIHFDMRLITPYQLGLKLISVNVSDIYAMGGTPMLAIAILGWPATKLPPELAQQVLEGARHTCKQAGIVLAGGHSIDAPEPMFGLAVNGRVAIAQLKRNDTAKVGDRLYLTKPLGVGILTTAQKQKKLLPEHATLARDCMVQLNRIGADIARLPGVHAMTDVTGFGLLGHLVEMCEGSGVNAELDSHAIPVLPQVQQYIAKGCIPGGSARNFASYGAKISPLSQEAQALLCDPQTSGGLLVAVSPDAEAAFIHLAVEYDLSLQPIGELKAQKKGHRIRVR